MKVMITGCGTLAKELASQLHPRASKLVIYSRDEAKHASLAHTFPEGPPSPVRYRLGDIRDLPRLTDAMSDCDMVIHTAALKRIDTCANNVRECIMTNVIGTVNVIKACLANKIQTAVFISTDKACDPLPGGYGISKLMAEQAWTHANSNLSTKFVALRYGNVAGSRGSVFELWRKQRDAGLPITVTDPDMTRFFWSIQEAASMTIRIMEEGQRGCLYIPKMRSWRMADLAKQFGSTEVTTTRTAEKVHEELITAYELVHTRELPDWYVVYPMWHQWCKDLPVKGEPVTITEYTSQTQLTSDPIPESWGVL
jgi:UDP-N-acetylglucosamine 4,6-dehydratase